MESAAPGKGGVLRQCDRWSSATCKSLQERVAALQLTPIRMSSAAAGPEIVSEEDPEPAAKAPAALGTTELAQPDKAAAKPPLEEGNIRPQHAGVSGLPGGKLADEAVGTAVAGEQQLQTAAAEAAEQDDCEALQPQSQAAEAEAAVSGPRQRRAAATAAARSMMSFIAEESKGVEVRPSWAPLYHRERSQAQ